MTTLPIPAVEGSSQPRALLRWLRGRKKSTGLVLFGIGAAAVLGLLSPPADVVADSDLTVHMFQHIGLFVGGMVLGYGAEILVMSELLLLKRLTYTGWRIFTAVMKLNFATKGVIFVALVPTLIFGYWHIPQNFDLAVQNESVHALEHLCYVTTGALAGMSVQAVSRRWRVIFLYLGFMQAGMMGSMWTVWRPAFFPVYSLSANLEMGTALMVFGALGVLGTSSWLLRVMDII